MMNVILFKKIGVGIFITLYFLVFAAVLGLYSLQRVFAERVYPGVTFAGVDFSGKNWDAAATEVEQIIQSLHDTILPLEIEGGPTAGPTLAELGVEFNKDTVLSDLFAVGHGTGLWNGAVAVFSSLIGKQSISLTATFNEFALERFIDKTTESVAKPAKNALLKVINGEVEIEPSEIGEQADPEWLKQEISERLSNLIGNQRVIALKPIFIEIKKSLPAITEDELIEVKVLAEDIIGEPIFMNSEHQEKTYTFTKADIGSWMIFKEVGNGADKTYQPEFNDAKIAASIAAKVARAVEVKMTPRKILVTTGQVVDEGRDGRALDRKLLLSEIKTRLASRSRPPISLAISDVPKTEQQVYPDFTLGLYEGRYIEINLTKQRMYAIEGGIIVNEYLISSGLEWGGYATPTGTMYIINKVGFAYSRRYNLWMPYWNGLSTTTDVSGYRGYGIHELPCFNRSCTWREGINHLGRPASHGCIRLGHNGPAQFIYDWAPIGTPVYIHR